MWDEITYPFLNFNGATVEVWEWISNSNRKSKLIIKSIIIIFYNSKSFTILCAIKLTRDDLDTWKRLLHYWPCAKESTCFTKNGAFVVFWWKKMLKLVELAMIWGVMAFNVVSMQYREGMVCVVFCELKVRYMIDVAYFSAIRDFKV